MKMEQTECSETSAYIIQTPGNYPKENIIYSEHGESLKSSIFKALFAGTLNPLNAELNPICHLLALLGARHILVSRARVKQNSHKPHCDFNRTQIDITVFRCDLTCCNRSIVNKLEGRVRGPYPTTLRQKTGQHRRTVASMQRTGSGVFRIQRKTKSSTNRDCQCKQLLYYIHHIVSTLAYLKVFYLYMLHNVEWVIGGKWGPCQLRTFRLAAEDSAWPWTATPSGLISPLRFSGYNMYRLV